MDDVMGWMKWLGLLVATLTVLVVGLMAYGSDQGGATCMRS